MAAPGETDLEAMLDSLDVERRPGSYTFVEVVGPPTPELFAAAHAVVVEEDGTTLVLGADDARNAGLVIDVEMAWLTLAVESSLEAVGLTAAVSRVLADDGIPCNVLAGYRHDHLLVPVDLVDAAARAIRSLRRR